MSKRQDMNKEVILYFIYFTLHALKIIDYNTFTNFESDKLDSLQYKG